MSLRDDVVRLLSRDGDGVAFADSAVPRLVKLLDLEGDALLSAAHELFRVAHFLDVEKGSPDASATLLTLLVASSDRIVAADVARSRRVVEEVVTAQKKLDAFRGDARVKSALTSGPRPAGTVPAGQARFATPPTSAKKRRR